MADGVGDRSRAVVGDGDSVLAGEVVCVIKVDRRWCDGSVERHNFQGINETSTSLSNMPVVKLSEFIRRPC